MKYDASTGTLIEVEKLDVHDGTVELPPGVQIIATGAFKGLDNIRRVVLPSNVTEIQEDAFCSCQNLEEINFEKKDTKVRIHECAFYNLPKLKKMALPFFEKIGTTTLFLTCPNLQEVIFAPPTSCFSQSVLSDINNIKRLVLPESIQKIDYYSTEKLKNIDIAIDTQSEEELHRIKNLFPEEIHSKIYIHSKPSTTCANFFFNALLGLAAVSGAALCVTALMVFSLPLAAILAAAGVACTVAAGIGLFAINRKRESVEHQDIAAPVYQPA